MLNNQDHVDEVDHQDKIEFQNYHDDLKKILINLFLFKNKFT
jgi:hypothetical protein